MLRVTARIAAHLQPAACAACALTAKASAKHNAMRTCCRTYELLISPRSASSKTCRSSPHGVVAYTKQALR
ncbi:hypothetical protein V8C86DRAFT_2533874 [Haematococcus lacustris]